jgi:ArsR family transcriptional regulator
MDELEKTVESFKAIGDKTRMRVLQLLSSTGNNLCVTAIAHKLAIAQPTVSQHLKVLKNAGILKANRIGNHIHYRIDIQAIDDLRDTISALIETTSQKCQIEDCLIQQKKA